MLGFMKTKLFLIVAGLVLGTGGVAFAATGGDITGAVNSGVSALTGGDQGSGGGAAGDQYTPPVPPDPAPPAPTPPAPDPVPPTRTDDDDLNDDADDAYDDDYYDDYEDESSDDSSDDGHDDGDDGYQPSPAPAPSPNNSDSHDSEDDDDHSITGRD